MAIEISKVNGNDIKKALSKVRTKFKSLEKNSAGSLRYTAGKTGVLSGSINILLFVAFDSLGFMMFNDNASAVWHPSIADEHLDILASDVELSAVVELDAFYKVVNSSKANTLFDISVDDANGVVTFCRNNRSYKISIVPGRDYMHSALLNILRNEFESTEGEHVKLGHDPNSSSKQSLIEALCRSYKFTSDDSCRENLTFVNLRYDVGSVDICSTDGHRMYYCKAFLDGKASTHEFDQVTIEPTVLQVFDSIYSDQYVLIDFVTDFKYFTMGLDEIEYKQDECNLFRIKVDNFVLASHVATACLPLFPDYSSVIPQYAEHKPSSVIEYQDAIFDKSSIMPVLNELKKFAGSDNSTFISFNFDSLTANFKNDAEKNNVGFEADVSIFNGHNSWERNLIRVNVEYMIEAVENIGSDYISVRSKDTFAPAVIRSDEFQSDRDEFILVMPMRV